MHYKLGKTTLLKHLAVGERNYVNWMIPMSDI